MQFPDNTCLILSKQHGRGDLSFMATGPSKFNPDQALVHTLGFDMQQLTAVLAMHRVGVVAGEPALWAFVAYLAWAKDGLQQSQKQRDAEDHDQYRQDVPAGADQGDVAKAGGSESGDSEVEGVEVVMNLRIGSDLSHIDDCRDHENEYQQIDHAEEDILVHAHEM